MLLASAASPCIFAGCAQRATPEAPAELTATQQQELNAKIQEVQNNPSIPATAKENIINGLKNNAAAKK